MSYDLMVFKKEAAPKTKSEFIIWYQHQTEWSEGHGYNDPANTSEDLKNWFMEMKEAFPAMNGPYASDDVDNPLVSDYSIGSEIIYVAFAWSVAEQAYHKALELAEKHDVGFFDLSNDNPNIFFPENGKMISIDKVQTGNSKKPWWKL